MRVRVDSWAWLPKSELSTSAIQALKAKLTIVPRKMPGYPEGEDQGPILLYKETNEVIGVARAYLLQHVNHNYEIDWNTTDGDKSTWPGDLKFSTRHSLREEQKRALSAVLTAVRAGEPGGIVKAPCGFGKTVLACALMAELNVPTLVVVHKEFLMNQWAERIEEYLPGAKIGYAQQDVCDFKGKNVVIGMIHSLAKDRYGEEFRQWPGLLISDECHRISARTWVGVAPTFPSSVRIGVSATPRRRDGAENVFNYHIGRNLFEATEQRMKPIVKRVYSAFRLVHTPSFNPQLAPESLILNFLCANEPRNRKIVELIVDALKAGRKLLVLSKRINHLERLDAMLHKEWKEAKITDPLSTGYFIGGMTEDARYKSSQARVIFATSQMASEALDIPPLDTLFLTCPMSDVEQAVGRILRPFEGKKDPIVVDIRDDEIKLFKALGANRDKLYQKIC